MSPKKSQNSTKSQRNYKIQYGGVTLLVTPSPKKYNKIQNYHKNHKMQNPKKSLEVEVQNTKRTVSSQLCCQICGVSNKKKNPLKPF